MGRGVIGTERCETKGKGRVEVESSRQTEHGVIRCLIHERKVGISTSSRRGVGFYVCHVDFI